MCVCLRIVVSNTYYVVFLFCFSSSCVPYVASLVGLPIFDCPPPSTVKPNDYLHTCIQQIFCIAIFAKYKIMYINQLSHFIVIN